MIAPYKIYLFEYDDGNTNLMSLQWDTEADCEYPTKPVAYIKEDLMKSVPDDVLEALDAIMLYIDDQCIYPDQFDIVQKWLDSQSAMPQAPWADAPEWAQWWAVDPDSIAYWFEVKPMFELGFWYCGTERKEKDGYYTLNLGLDHRMSLQERPRETV